MKGRQTQTTLVILSKGQVREEHISESGISPDIIRTLKNTPFIKM